MSLRNDLPAVAAAAMPAPANFSFEPPSTAYAYFEDAPIVDSGEEPGVIDIFGPIYDGPWQDEVGARDVKRQLAKVKGQPVTVRINSPGGSLLEGVTIYNLLRLHEGEVTVQVIGLAASAASVIAMAGDKVEMATGSFMMIHNAWICMCGDKSDFAKAVEYLTPFDENLRDLYVARTGLGEAEVTAMLDTETWLTANQAVAKGFADSLVEITPSENEPANAVREDIAAKRQIEAALAQQGLPRSKRRELMNTLSGGKSRAAADPAPPGTPRAAGAGDLGPMHDAEALIAACERGIDILSQ